jgi:hypothetical protein
MNINSQSPSFSGKWELNGMRTKALFRAVSKQAPEHSMTGDSVVKCNSHLDEAMKNFLTKHKIDATDLEATQTTKPSLFWAHRFTAPGYHPAKVEVIKARKS